MVFTVFGIEPSTDGWTRFIDLTAILTVKVFAAVLNIKVPFSFLNKDRGLLVADIPTDVFKVIPGCWFINLHGKILAAKRIALLTRPAHPILPIKYST